MFSADHAHHSAARRGVTIGDAVVAIAVLGLIAVLMGPVVIEARETAVGTTPCMSRMRGLGTAVAMCYAEHNDYGPSSDDGVGGFTATTMFSWTDLLYDEGYLAGKPNWICPEDARPDPPAAERGHSWRCQFVDEFGVDEPFKRGVRTSYAINFTVSQNFKQDRFSDAARQIYAVDGWWSWFGNMGAFWLFSEDLFGQRVSVLSPNGSSNMIGYRHGDSFRANALFMDGHVAGLTPQPPAGIYDYYFNTFDTTTAFTWLPGEMTDRYTTEDYDGSIDEYDNRTPFWTDPPAHMVNAETGMPIDCASELNCYWRTQYNAWIRLPSDPADRW